MAASNGLATADGARDAGATAARHCRLAGRGWSGSSASGWGSTTSPSISKDTSVYPSFTDAVRTSIDTESVSFINEVRAELDRHHR